MSNPSYSTTVQINSLEQLINTYIGFFIFVIILSIIIELLFLGACVHLANDKGRSGFLWGVLGFLLGGLALIILVYLPTQVYYDMPKTTNSWTCSYCKKLHFGNGEKCSACGNYRVSSSTQKSNFASPQTQKSNSASLQIQKSNPIQLPKNAKPWACPNCGETNKGNALNCINCFAQNPSTIPETPKAKTWTCPKCGEENNINAKNCINCFAEKP